MMTIFNTAVVTHIIFGLTAFAGSVISVSAFGDTFHELTRKQKIALSTTYIGVMGSTVLGFASRFDSTLWLVGTVAAITVFTFVSVARISKKAAIKVAKKKA